MTLKSFAGDAIVVGIIVRTLISISIKPNSFNVSLCTHGKTHEQAKAIIGNAVKITVRYSSIKNKPLVIEKLDFQIKKRDLDSLSSKRSRALSSFGYSSIIKMLEARAFRHSIAVYQVNPAYSSVIGRVKFANDLNISTHNAAAMVIARIIYIFRTITGYLE